MTDDTITKWVDAIYLDPAGLALAITNPNGGFQMDRQDVVELLKFLRDNNPDTQAFKGFVAGLYTG